MGMFAWLRRHLAPGAQAVGGPAFDEPGPQTRFGMRPGAVVDGLDFYQAIDFQRRWKLRLVAYVRGEACAREDWKRIERDDQCELGRWLRHARPRDPRHAELFEQLRKQHTELHHEAAEIVRLAEAGQRDAALIALRQGGFARASHALVARLSELFTALNGSGAGPH